MVTQACAVFVPCLRNVAMILADSSLVAKSSRHLDLPSPL